MQIIRLGLLLLCIIGQLSYGQVDTLAFDSGNRITGEIKKMEKGVLEIDTEFGDNNLMIKWLKVKYIHTTSTVLVSVKNNIYQGRLHTDADNKIRVFDADSTYIICDLQDIVYLKQYKDGFSNRFGAAVEIGFNLTKAQDVRQFSFRSSVNYKTNKSSLSASYNILRASQDNTDAVRRTDGLLNYTRLIFKKWYGIASIQTLSNTEQKIDIRANSQIGIGNYLYTTNKAYWGIKTGINNNLERFSNVSSNRNTWEVFYGTELNLYDIQDFNLIFNFNGYSGLTETGRFRADTTIDVKYELPWDFFIRVGYSLNYDNRPTVNASDTDYILRTGIGWEW